MKKKLIFSFMILFVLIFSLNSHFVYSQTDFIKINWIEILTGQIETENEFTYLFEDENYLIRIEMTFPQEYRKEIKIISNLTGSIWVRELEKRSKTGEIEFDLIGLRDTITIDLEGKTPKALVTIEGSPATSKDDRIIIGEKEFELFKILVQEIPMKLRSEQVNRFMLSSHEIFNAKIKIQEAQDAVEEFKKSTNFDLKIARDIIARIESLLIIADECLGEGAPDQAFQIANQCLILINSNILEDQARMFNYMVRDTQIDFAESSSLLFEALDEIESARESETPDECIQHLENARNHLDKARESYVQTVNNEILKFEFSVTQVVFLAIILTVIFSAIFSYLMFQRSRKRIYEQGIKVGEKKAAKEVLSPRDIILGKKMEGEE